MRELFPEPETPVTQMNRPSGKDTVTFLRLFSVAPSRVSVPLDLLLGVRILVICSFPVRYLPVRDSGFSFTAAGEPSATTRPPSVPAPGPKSTTWSALRIVSLSCSTTRTVLPRSRSFSRVLMSLSLSR